ncbi:MAG: hypothetical protein J7639_14860 [Paenibacillaceae bacterium]|nr:hypothetical protein [Paenibacillaceae bacterium]
MTQHETDENERAAQEQHEAIIGLFRLVEHILDTQFEDYQVQSNIGQHPIYGPMYAYGLIKEDKVYACGFFATELIPRFQEGNDPAGYVESFFVDMIREGDSRPLPQPPQTEDEAKALFDNVIVPYCAKTVRAEFEEDTVYVDLDVHPEHGPVLEAGFPVLIEGVNTCAMPLQFLLALYLLNRDPADPFIQALWKLKDERKEELDRARLV